VWAFHQGQLHNDKGSLLSGLYGRKGKIIMAKNAFVSGLISKPVPATPKLQRKARSNTPAFTANRALTLPDSGQPVVDLFHLIGAMRGKDILPVFEKAYRDNQELALRTALYGRDVRQGAGERKIFRDILLWLEKHDMKGLYRLLPRVPELGRWDDLLVFTGEGRAPAFELIRNGLFNDAYASQRGLCAKWMPRKGIEAAQLREYLGLSPKQYRKTLVNATKVVEQQMCAGEWDQIIYDHVSSVAASRYRKAFWKHSPERYKAYVEALKKPVVAGQKPAAKINAGAIYPYDIIKTFYDGSNYTNHLAMRSTGPVVETAIAQWNALPDFVGEGSFLPLIDVSGSMSSWTNGAGIPNVAPLHVALSIGLYVAERNKSDFKDMYLTFTSHPTMGTLKGNIVERVRDMLGSRYAGSTDLQAAFKAILDHAKRHSVPAADMPQALIIVSDMEFNSTTTGWTNFDQARLMYEQAGYALPKIVFWNVNGREKNTPVDYKQDGSIMISGFSPAIMKNVLSMKNSNPLDMVLDKLMVPRYNLAD
jgi:hypothetical protein